MVSKIRHLRGSSGAFLALSPGEDLMLPNWFNLKWKRETAASRGNPNMHAHDLWQTYSCAMKISAERETLEWLYTLVCLLKPRCVLETGTYRGHATLYLGKALQDLDLCGKLLTVEVNEAEHSKAVAVVASQGLTDTVTCALGSSLTYNYADWCVERGYFEGFDLVFIDCLHRTKALRHILELGAAHKNTLFVFHDTAAKTGTSRKDVERITLKDLEAQLFINNTPRGLLLAKLKQEKHLSC